MRASVNERGADRAQRLEQHGQCPGSLGVGCVLAALAGVLVAPTLTLSATSLTLLIVNAYAASVIGRLRSIPMTFVGAVILGMAVSYSVAYLPQSRQGRQGLRHLVDAARTANDVGPERDT